LHIVPTAAEQPSRLLLRADVTLHDVTRTLSVPAEVETTNAAVFYIKGRFSLKQTDFGIEPFSFMGGALQVQDKVDIDFELMLVPLQR
jgi:polyisoprenoid-binding protein YceI